jgi:aminoglycoside phosphotransferase (APT) family kinase protein
MSALDAAAARRALLRHRPNQDFGDLRLLGEGWDSIVYLAGDATVLRFPKTSSAAHALETEIRLLPYLRDRLPLPIPAPAIVAEHPCNPAWRFMGYPRIRGSEVTRERFATLAPEVQARVLRDLAEFLAALHDSDESAVRRRGVSARNLRAEFIDVFARSQTAVLPLLERVERRGFIGHRSTVSSKRSVFSTPRATSCSVRGASTLR